MQIKQGDFFNVDDCGSSINLILAPFFSSAKEIFSASSYPIILDKDSPNILPFCYNTERSRKC